MFNNLWARYYQKNKERLQKRLFRGMRIFRKKKKKEKQQYGSGRIKKPFLDMKSKRWLTIGKFLQNVENGSQTFSGLYKRLVLRVLG